MFSVIFDMDGTLLDTQRICIPAWEYAGNLQGISGMGEQIYKVCGMNENGWTNHILTHFPTIEIDSFKRNVRAYILENGKVIYKKGAEELLRFLKQNGVKIGLASGSSRASVEHHLEEVGATDYFEAFACSHDVVNGKPAPDVFLLAAERLGVNPQDCFVFEDSKNGIIAAHKAGMKCIGIADVIPFDEDTKKLMFKELNSLDEAIPLLKTHL